MNKIIVTILLLLATFSLSKTARSIAGEVEYIYDNLNRVADVIYDGQAKISYSHDDVGNRETAITDTDGDGVADDLDPFPDDPTQ
jgi:hypothetical protein